MSKRIGYDLISKSREAMIAAVAHYNNPAVTFKSELFIVTAIIAWTYLMHAYFKSIKIDYRCTTSGGNKKYVRTKNGAFKYWGLEACIDDKASPLDSGTKTNLKFLLGIRHEIEHKKSNRIDAFIGAKLQACALNYNRVIVEFFGEKYSIADKLSLNIQFSALTKSQKKTMAEEGFEGIPSNVRSFITTFEDTMENEVLSSTSYSYHVALVPLSINNKNKADECVMLVKEGSEEAKNAQRVLFKEIEKEKYRPGDVIKIMHDEGYVDFRMHDHTRLWQSKDARKPGKNYGVWVANTWYWYKSWVEVVRKHCQERYKK